ncbi:MAG: polyhydroxyalkanoic acid system family protein [Rhodothermales bacterium]
MAIEIHRSHHLDKTTTRRMVEEIAAMISEQFTLTYEWHDDRLSFKRLGVSGHIDIADHEVHIVVDKSPWLPVSEAHLREQIEATMNEYMG